MNKRNKSKSDNVLEYIPVRNESINWNNDENGIITLEIENKGLFNRIAQTVFKKPKKSYVHLDETGSFVWPLIDGKADILKIAESVKEHFGDKADPLYERLVKYFKILESYGFIKLNK